MEEFRDGFVLELEFELELDIPFVVVEVSDIDGPVSKPFFPDFKFVNKISSSRRQFNISCNELDNPEEAAFAIIPFTIGLFENLTA